MHLNKNRQNNKVDDNFQFAIWPVLVVAQFFGVMPMIGLRSRNITFRWRSFRAVYSIVFMTLGSFICWLYMGRLQRTGVTAKNLGGGVFYVCNIACCLFFFNLAGKWNVLISKWTETENIFLMPPYQRNGYRLATKLRASAALYLFLAFSEHVIFTIQCLWNYKLKTEECGWEGQDHWKLFFIIENRYVVEIIPYSVPLSIVKIWLDITFTFNATFVHIFLILASVGLSTRFQQLNNRLESWKGQKISDELWSEIRNHYVLLCELLELVDSDLAPIILLSCANNLYFICVQLLNIFETLPHLPSYIYFWYSLLFFIFRTVCVFLCAAAINDASRKPSEMFRWIPSAEWCSEVDRFSVQVDTELIALSGMKFFFLTRKVLLGMVGTILTYELVLLQFSESTKETDNQIESSLASCQI